jgi:hypothetical protein
MEIFKATIKDDGKSFIIRPLLNAKDLKNHIIRCDTGIKGFMNLPIYEFLCFALVDDELKIIRFGRTLFNFMRDNSVTEHVMEMLQMKCDKAIKLTMRVRQGYPDPLYEIVQDDKYRFDNTPEKRKYISDLLLHTELDLMDALEFEKERISKLREEIENEREEKEIEEMKKRTKQKTEHIDVDPYGEEDWSK